MEIKLTAGDVTLDFTRALIVQDTVSIEVDLGLGGDRTFIEWLRRKPRPYHP